MTTSRNSPSRARNHDEHLSQVERQLRDAVHIIGQGRREIERSRHLIGSEPLALDDSLQSDSGTSGPQEPSR